MGWILHVAYMRELRNAYKLLVSSPEEKRSLARARH
jgi:hypothetical protein